VRATASYVKERNATAIRAASNMQVIMIELCLSAGVQHESNLLHARNSNPFVADLRIRCGRFKLP
jgi:hypothetical protein